MPHRTPPQQNRIFAKQMRRAMPDAEFRLWCELRNRGLGMKFRRQHPIGPYIVDFFCPAKNLVVEVDGEQHALNDHPEREAQRTQWLEAQGYSVVRFWTHEVMHELDGVCEAILAASRGEWRNAPHPAG
jgi:very-short-patch-repair endonuclease